MQVHYTDGRAMVSSATRTPISFLILLFTGVLTQQAPNTTTTTIGPTLPSPPKPSLSANTTESASGGKVSDCKVAYTVGYGYRRLYYWASSLVEKKANGSTSVNSATLNFRVRAFSDAHIMFSTSPAPVEREPVYEIVLGAGRNSFSDIRRLRRSGTQVTMPTPDIVSPYELRGFWVRVSNDGTIEVGREGDDTAFMGWRDPQPLPVRYFAFCTWTGTVGKWEYDCPTNESDQAQEATEVDPKLTWTQQLRRDLLSRYDPYVRPSVDHDQTTTVHLHLACQHITLNEEKSIISVHGTMSMHWMDEKLVWNAEHYDGLKSLNAASHEIWLPELLLYNAADGAGDSVFNSEATRVTVSANGAVMWSPQAHLQALCPLRLGAWPRDRHVCSLRLGVWSHAALVTLQLMENGTVLDEQHTSSQWLVEKVSARHELEAHPWLLPETGDSEDAETTAFGSVFTLEVTICRQSSTYLVVLLTPVAAVATSMAASFWISPLDLSRSMLCATNLLLISAFMAGVALNLPATADKIPHIVLVFNGGLLVATVAMMLTVLAIILARPKRVKPPSSFITAQLNGILGLILMLPPSKDGSGGGQSYNQLDEPKDFPKMESPEEYRDVASMIPSAPTDSNAQEQWLRLATAIDRLAFIVYCIFIAITFI